MAKEYTQYWLERRDNRYKSGWVSVEDMWLDGRNQTMYRPLHISASNNTDDYLLQVLLEYGFNPRKYRLVRYKDEQWREREASRLARNDCYTTLPKQWSSLEPIVDHYAHVSESGNSIAFTENEAKGELDIQTVMKPGRYLKKFYPHLDDNTIRDLAVHVSSEPKMSIAITADDIEQVYLNGPSSCMSHPLNEYDSAEHPVRVYGDSDIQLAYLGSLKKATARALIRPDNKSYVRIYGDSVRLERALKAAGYESKISGFMGAKVRKIVHTDNVFVMPYLDGSCQCVDTMGEYLIINDDSEYICNQTNGLAGEPEDDRVLCEWCGERHIEDGEEISVNTSTRNPRQTQIWCENCVDNSAFRCEGTDEYYSVASFSSITTANGNVYEAEYFDEAGGFTCDATDKNYIDEYSIYLEDTNETVCASYAKEYCYHDIESDTWYREKPIEDTNENQDTLETTVQS